MGLISINTKEAIFEWLISDPRVDKKRGPAKAPPFSLLVRMLFLGWKKKVDGFLRGWFCRKADDKIDD